MVRVYAPGAVPPLVSLPPAEAHHVGRVLRLRADASVVVFDGRGREWLGRLASVARDVVSVELVAERQPVVEPAVAVTLGIGLLKGEQMDSVVRDATALGAASIVPILSAHVAVSNAARRARSLDRWQRVAIASAKQCARAVVPTVEPPMELETLLERAGGSLLLCCLEPSRRGGQSLEELPRRSRVFLLVGPEGGWSDEEVARCLAAGACELDLGPRTLRAELAPAVALSALWSRWGWH